MTARSFETSMEKKDDNRSADLTFHFRRGFLDRESRAFNLRLDADEILRR